IWYTACHEEDWRLHDCRREGTTPVCHGRPTALRAFRVERATVQDRAALLLDGGSGRGRVRAVAESDLRPLPISAFPVEEPWRVVDDAVWALQPGEAGSLVLVEHPLREGGPRRLATLHGLRLLLGEGFGVSADRRRMLLPVVTENRADIGVSRLHPDAGGASAETATAATRQGIRGNPRPGAGRETVGKGGKAPRNPAESCARPASLSPGAVRVFLSGGGAGL